jgi:hypothetical protein
VDFEGPVVVRVKVERAIGDAEVGRRVRHVGVEVVVVTVAEGAVVGGVQLVDRRTLGAVHDPETIGDDEVRVGIAPGEVHAQIVGGVDVAVVVHIDMEVVFAASLVDVQRPVGPAVGEDHHVVVGVWIAVGIWGRLQLELRQIDGSSHIGVAVRAVTVDVGPQRSGILSQRLIGAGAAVGEADQRHPVWRQIVVHRAAAELVDEANRRRPRVLDLVGLVVHAARVVEDQSDVCRVHALGVVGAHQAGQPPVA